MIKIVIGTEKGDKRKMTKKELATERNEVREILEGFSEELSQSNLDKLSRVFCIINGDEKRIEELKDENQRLSNLVASYMTGEEE